jgi:hypothetical protein
MKTRWILVAALSAAPLLSVQCPERPLRIFFLSKSSGFEHPVIRPAADGGPSVVEAVLRDIATELGAELTSTKNAALIDPIILRDYDVLIFFTTGDLRQSGTDGEMPMGSDGLYNLLTWIRDGGGFIGVHSASDTFHRAQPGGRSPFLEMLGAEFLQHGEQFEGTVRVVDPDHATMRDVPAEWTLTEEWYIFTEVQRYSIHPLLLFDPGDEGEVQPMYDVEPYPIAWWSRYGDGRVYYTGLAHNAETWQDPIFRTMVKNAILWAALK